MNVLVENGIEFLSDLSIWEECYACNGKGYGFTSENVPFGRIDNVMIECPVCLGEKGWETSV